MREVYSNTILPQETRKASNRQPNSTSKAAGKEEPKNQCQQKKKIIKIRAETKRNKGNNGKD